jgi:NADH dehydrogenase [ubiquinone] 1 alpha subcomplex assembly factor 1
MQTHVIFNFNKSSDINGWTTISDVVMGGTSSGSFKLNSEGHGLFEGVISLENNGGFSLVSYKFKKSKINNYTKIVLKLKGDGKTYQFRIKSNTEDYYSYVYYFSTTGEWEEVEIPLKEMYPTFRGKKLEKSNFSNEYIEEIAFLIGNKNEENFKLIIDNIVME